MSPYTEKNCQMLLFKKESHLMSLSKESSCLTPLDTVESCLMLLCKGEDACVTMQTRKKVFLCHCAFKRVVRCHREKKIFQMSPLESESGKLPYVTLQKRSKSALLNFAGKLKSKMNPEYQFFMFNSYSLLYIYVPFNRN